jgi:hypothetical protein
MIVVAAAAAAAAVVVVKEKAACQNKLNFIRWVLYICCSATRVIILLFLCALCVTIKGFASWN